MTAALVATTSTAATAAAVAQPQPEPITAATIRGWRDEVPPLYTFVSASTKSDPTLRDSIKNPFLLTDIKRIIGSYLFPQSMAAFNVFAGLECAKWVLDTETPSLLPLIQRYLQLPTETEDEALHALNELQIRNIILCELEEPKIVYNPTYSGLRATFSLIEARNCIRCFRIVDNPAADAPSIDKDWRSTHQSTETSAATLRNWLQTHSEKVATQTVMDLRSKHLTLFPLEVLYYVNVETLILDLNWITFLPPAIGGLKKLKSLRINSNFIESLPAAVASFPQLEFIGARFNRLTSLPDDLLYKDPERFSLCVSYNYLDRDTVHRFGRFYFVNGNDYTQFVTLGGPAVEHTPPPPPPADTSKCCTLL